MNLMKQFLTTLLFVALAAPAIAWPPGWTVRKSAVAPAAQLPAFSRKLGGHITRITNTTFDVHGHEIRVNEVVCATPADAKAVARAIGSRAYVDPKHNSVTELVSTDRRLMVRAPYDLGLAPRTLTYSLKFTCAPLDGCDYMSWNAMYNAWLRKDASAIQKLAGKFRFGRTIVLSRHGQGTSKSAYTFDATATDKSGHYTFKTLPSQLGVPQVRVSAQVTSKAFGTLAGKNGSTAATRRWPVDDPGMKALATKITGQAGTPSAKVDALLDWVVANCHYGGAVRGSRLGVQTFLAHKQGECWDYSDAFITLARASGIPARQVIGWLVRGSKADGHVWVQVLLGGRWVPVDPTSGAGCGSDHVPLSVSDDGELSFVYTSPVMIETRP